MAPRKVSRDPVERELVDALERDPQNITALSALGTLLNERKYGISLFA